LLSGADCREQRFSPLLRLTTRSDTRLFSTLFPLPLPLLLSLNKTKQNDQRHKKRATHGLEKKSMLSCLPCARRSQSPLYLYHAWNTPTCEHSLYVWSQRPGYMMRLPRVRKETETTIDDNIHRNDTIATRVRLQWWQSTDKDCRNGHQNEESSSRVERESKISKNFSFLLFLFLTLSLSRSVCLHLYPHLCPSVFDVAQWLSLSLQRRRVFQMS
jgi:hypothetical protein